MEKIFGATERHDQLLVFGTNRAVLIYGYGEENGQGYDYRHVFNHHPSPDEIREIIVSQIDANTDAKILTGYQWTILHGDLTKPEEARHVGETVNVWLNMENQNNYKEAHRLACLDASKVVPVKFKVSQDSKKNAIYETFETFDELNAFYMGAFAFIKNVLDDGWDEKDNIDLTKFGYE
jgi:hypothetical protein